jgi:hypothetical protein
MKPATGAYKHAPDPCSCRTQVLHQVAARHHEGQGRQGGQGGEGGEGREGGEGALSGQRAWAWLGQASRPAVELALEKVDKMRLGGQRAEAQLA